MTTVTVDSPEHLHLHLDAVPLIDLRYLSQSELNSLSLCSDKAFDLRRCDDVIIPKIDRSVFNESAGSRKQTYSRLRLAPRKPEISAVGRGRYNPVPKPHTNPVDDPERKENKEIVSLLRDLFSNDPSIQFKEKNLEMVTANDELYEEPALPMVTVSMPPPPPPQPSEVPVVGPDGVVKRKRGRPRKDVANLEPKAPSPKVRKVEGDDFYENVQINENVAMEIVNKNGVVVDLAALACREDPYGPELRRRAIDLTSEEELLAFLRELNGQWGSRRKKRKVVDASDFGDALPIGWKLLISLRRKEGHLSLYCRRYISPTGQQFVSCKEVSSYLLPFFGFQSENRPNPFQSDESELEINKLSSGSSAGAAHTDDITKDELVNYAASPTASFSSEREKPLALLETENLAEVEIKDLLECHICKTSFNEKDAYLQHLLSSHQKSAKRSRHGNVSVCDGVIIRDGKYECQFCHKIFDERHRYNGHVGNHVKKYVRSLELSPGNRIMQNNIKPSSVNRVLSGFSGKDASVDIGKSSAVVTSITSNEKCMQNNVKLLSIPRSSEVDAPDNIDKSSLKLSSRPSDESISKDNVMPSSVSGLLPVLAGVEASAAVEQAFVPPSSVSGLLPVLAGVEASAAVEQAFVPSSSVSGLLPVLAGVEAAAVEQAFVPPNAMPSTETIMHNNNKPLFASRVLPGLSGLEASDDMNKEAVLVTSIRSDERSMQNNVKPSSLGEVLPGVSGMETSACIDKCYDTLISIPSKETSMHAIVEPSSADEVLPGFSGADASADNENGSVLQTSIPSIEISIGSPCGKFDANSDTDVLPTSIPSNEINVGSPCGKRDADSESDVSSSKGNSEHNFPDSKSDSGVDMPQSSFAKPLVENVNSDVSSAKGNSEQNSPGSGSDIGDIPQSSPINLLVENVDLDVSSAQGNSEQNYPYSKPDTKIDIPQSSLTNSLVENVGSPDDGLGSGFTPEISTSTSNFELNVGFPRSKKDLGDNNIDASLGGESADNQGSGNEMIDGKVGRVDKNNNDMNVDLRSCLDFTASLCNNVGDVAFESFKGRYGWTSRTEHSLGKVDQTNNVLDGDFRLCLGPTSALHDNVENGTNVTFEGHNVFTSTAVGVNMFDLNQREDSFCFAFAPSGSEKTHGVEICTDGGFSSNLKNLELDKGKGSLFNESPRCFDTNIRQSKEESLIDTIGSADKDTLFQRLNADTPPSFLQSSGCFPTLDLMSNKGEGESGSFSLQKFDNMSGFEELGFDDLEPSKYGFVGGKGSSSLTQEPMDLAYDSVLDEALNTSVQFEWDAVLPKTNNNQQQSSICVWCRMPFNHVDIYPEMQSDSVGYMCPTCKVKISGQLNVFGQ